MIDMHKASELWKSGMSQSNIGKYFGMTKGQIAGIFSRNRNMFPKRNDKLERLEADINSSLFESINDEIKKVNIQLRRPSNTLRKMFNEAFKVAQPIPSKAENEAYDKSRLEHAVSLFDLDSRGCKWAVQDSPYLFCGERRYKMKPWCEAHHQRAWRAQ